MAISAWADLAQAGDAAFEFTVSGDLVGRLEPDTRVLIWSPVIETKPKWVRFSLKELPVNVPYQQLAAGHTWIASFTSPSQRQAAFSIGLDRNLFDKPRRIDMKLDRPSPRIRPSCLGKRLEFQYYAGITRRMWYWDLPAWDDKTKRIVPAAPPSMSIVRAADSRTVQESVMTTGCMGSKWWAALDPSLDLGDKADLQLAVRYDSGGLWEPITTALPFTYRAADHGRPQRPPAGSPGR